MSATSPEIVDTEVMDSEEPECNVHWEEGESSEDEVVPEPMMPRAEEEEEVVELPRPENFSAALGLSPWKLDLASFPYASALIPRALTLGDCVACQGEEQFVKCVLSWVFFCLRCLPRHPASSPYDLVVLWCCRECAEKRRTDLTGDRVLVHYLRTGKSAVWFYREAQGG